jgi:RNA polymerase sigma factor (sigma-70 family)
MAQSERASILGWIRHISAEVGGASDAQLVDRFASTRDETAFELLVWRHARLVFDICRRVLDDQHDAEDAFQATFLALARHAGRVAKREAVASWLYKVAYRMAVTARGQRAGHRKALLGAGERLTAASNGNGPAETQELRQILDEEIIRLPERFRAPLVLCYLEGKSVDEAATQLGCPRGTVASRLARGRERLRVRLAGRGLAVTAGLAFLSRVGAAPGPVALFPSLIAATLRCSAEELHQTPCFPTGSLPSQTRS